MGLESTLKNDILMISWGVTLPYSIAGVFAPNPSIDSHGIQSQPLSDSTRGLRSAIPSAYGRFVRSLMFREYDHVDGGTLVYDVRTEHRDHLPHEVEVSRRLLGFATVTDWEKIRLELT